MAAGSQSSGGAFVYVLSAEDEAVIREVRLGNQNPFFIKVEAGLDEGERVITSSYSGFGDAEKIIIE